MKKSLLIKQMSLVASAGMLMTACASRDYNDDYSYYPASSSSSGQYESDTYGNYESAQSESQQYSSAEQDQSESIAESSGAQTLSGSQNQISIPLHEERLNVGKRTVDAGQVTIRKVVTTETVNQPVQLRKETLIIDRNDSGSRQSSSFSSQQDSDWQRGNQDQNRFSENARDKSEVEEAAGAAADRSNGASGNAFQEETFTIRLQEEQPVIEKVIVQTGSVTARKDAQMEQQNVQRQVRREDVKLDRSGAQNVQIRGDFQSASGQINEPSGAERRNDSSLDRQQSDQQLRQNNRDITPRQGQGAQDLQQGIRPDDSDLQQGQPQQNDSESQNQSGTPE